jgi:hypothetical protein
MKLTPSKVGAEPKKIAILGGLVLAAGIVYFYNTSSGGSAGSSPATANRSPAPNSVAATQRSRSTTRNPQQTSGSAREFRPSLKPKNIDPAGIDPTLRLDLLAKLKDVTPEAGTRSIFEIAAAPPVPAALTVPEPAKIAVTRPFIGPVQPKPAAAPPEPKAPPIPLKFYGFVNKNKAGDKRAFFLDGEDIVIAGEGDMIKKRYKIVRIGVNSAVVEDTEFKTNNQQTLPLEAELAG